MRLLAADRLVTCDEARATPSDPLGVLAPGVVCVRDGRVAWVDGLDAAVASGRVTAAELATAERARLITPGLVDAHTHAPWVGSRHDEYLLRLAGAGYEEIARAGGGIASTTRSVRAASAEELHLALRARLRRMAALGVTTVECKSGYGLDLASERKQLEAARACAGEPGLPRVVPTFLALHALPPEAGGDRAAYARGVREHALPAIVREGLAGWIDAYVDRSAFSVEDARPVLRAAVERGLRVRLHVGQFADVGGAELAAEVGAASIDHAEHVEPAGVEALARAGVRVTLLPTASFTLAQAAPPIARFRAAGLRLVVASDANPGTAPTESLPLALALAARTYGLGLAECLLGATREAAASLGLEGEVGALREGLSADLVSWDLPHEAALLQPWGTSRALEVLRAGRPLAAP